jgi:hypothetical protein
LQGWSNILVGGFERRFVSSEAAAQQHQDVTSHAVPDPIFIRASKNKLGGFYGKLRCPYTIKLVNSFSHWHYFASPTGITLQVEQMVDVADYVFMTPLSCAHSSGFI